MKKKTKHTFLKAPRPKSRVEVMAWRFEHAKASLAIEGLSLTTEEIDVFEECIRNECTIEERSQRLKQAFPCYDLPICA